jgi:serine/threonine protein kinase
MATPAIEPEANDTRVLPAGDDTRVLPAGDDTRVLPAALERPPAPPMRSEENHNLFNRYEYNPRTGLIGRGGFSRVYKAFDKKLNRWVALKIYKTGEFSDRYSPIAEIRRVVNLDHPNICRYLDIEEIEKENAFGEREQTQICVMELLDGGTLLEYYTAHPTENVLRKLLTDVLNGLAYLHKNGIIHRDIKPANILIRETYDGPVAKITDFGISKLSDSVNNQSSSALVVSIPYMAPEQLNVRKYGMQEKISFNLDLWALGVTIYEIMTGKILFKNTDQDSSEQIMTNIVSSGIPEKIAELPQPFVDIVRRCVVKDARERVQKADELIILLNRTLPERTAAAHTSRQLPASKPAPDDKPVPPDEKPVAPNEKTVAPDDKAAPVPPRSFSVIGEEETEVKKKPRRGQEQWVIYLRIAVVAAALLLGISLYIYVQNRRLKEAMTFASPKADSVAIVDQPAVSPGSGGSAVSGGAGAVTAAPAAPARTDSGTRTPGAQKQAGQGGTAGSAGNAGNTANAGTGTGAGSGANAVSDSGQAMKKVHRNADRKKDRLSEPAGEDGKYVVLLTATQTCSITINNISYGTLKSGKAMWVRLGPGSYVIQATDAENGAPPYTGRLEVKPTDLNQVGKIKIPL